MNQLRPLIAGNWKMNGLKASIAQLEAMIADAGPAVAKADLLVCPPATLVAAFADKASGSTILAVGAQDCHPIAIAHRAQFEHLELVRGSQRQSQGNPPLSGWRRRPGHR